MCVALSVVSNHFTCLVTLTNLHINPLDSKGNYSATSNNTKLVHWPFMGGLLHLVQRGVAWASCGSAQSPPRCIKCKSPPINGQCTDHCIANMMVCLLLCGFNVAIEGLMDQAHTMFSTCPPNQKHLVAPSSIIDFELTFCQRFTIVELRKILFRQQYEQVENPVNHYAMISIKSCQRRAVVSSLCTMTYKI